MMARRISVGAWLALALSFVAVASPSAQRAIPRILVTEQQYLDVAARIDAKRVASVDHAAVAALAILYRESRVANDACAHERALRAIDRRMHEWYGAEVPAYAGDCEAPVPPVVNEHEAPKPEPTPPGPVARKGIVRAQGRLLVDDGGPFQALGASFFWAPWAWTNDRPRLERNLALLAGTFDFIRVFGDVGPKYWEDREINPGAPGYDEMVTGLTDLAYDKYGMRVEWTIFAGVDHARSAGDRAALVDRFARLLKGREHKVILVEIGNEMTNIGFPDYPGEPRALARRFAEQSPNLVAISAPGAACEDGQSLYRGSAATVGTWHFDRDVTKAEGPWRPVRQPWEYQFCEGLPSVGWDNEPIGPGSSVSSENDVTRIASGPIVSSIAGLSAYVFHSRAGIYGGGSHDGAANFDELPQLPQVLAAWRAMKAYMPADVSGWTRQNHYWPGHPFSDIHIWMDDNAPAGVVREYAAVSGPRFVTFPMGVRREARMRARAAMHVKVYDPATGALLVEADLGAGQEVVLRGDDDPANGVLDAFVIVGEYR